MAPAAETKTCKKCARVFKDSADFTKGTSRWRKSTDEALWFDCSCGSTLMLAKGSYPWYSPQTGMSANAASLFNRLSDVLKLPAIPAAVLRLQQLIEQPETTPAMIAQSLRAAPDLAAKLLHSASVLKASSGQRIEKLEHAVVYVGRSVLKDLVTVAAVQGLSEGAAASSKSFHAASFWEQSFLTAMIADRIASTRLPKLPADEVYLAACLCNVGKIIAAMCFPAAFDAVHAEVTTPATLKSWPRAEQSRGTEPHTLLGEIGAALWGFPAVVSEAAGKHHAPPPPGKGGPGVVHVVALANQLSHWLRLDAWRIDEPVMESSAQAIGIGKAEIESVAAQLMPLKAEVERLIAS